MFEVSNIIKRQHETYFTFFRVLYSNNNNK